MNELVHDGLRVFVLGRDLAEGEEAAEASRAPSRTAASPDGDPRHARRRLTALARRPDGRLALRRLATDLLGSCDVHRLGDAELVDLLVDAITAGRLVAVTRAEHGLLEAVASPRILRETGRTPSAPKPKSAAVEVAAAAAEVAPKPGKKWPPDPDIPPEYPHMARLESAAIERARLVVAVALDDLVFRGLPSVPTPLVAPEYPIMAKAQADALRDLAATMRAELRLLTFTRLDREAAAPPKPADEGA